MISVWDFDNTSVDEALALVAKDPKRPKPVAFSLAVESIRGIDIAEVGVRRDFEGIVPEDLEAPGGRGHCGLYGHQLADPNARERKASKLVKRKLCEIAQRIDQGGLG